MIKIENVEILGWEHAIRGMRNPMNSWEKMDSHFNLDCDYIDCDECPGKTNNHHPHGYDCCDRLRVAAVNIGPNDHTLMMNLAHGGPVHAKYRRMITVYLDITAPLYWWKEFDTYKVGTVANSCSTMHKIHAKEFELSDFSHEHLVVDGCEYLDGVIHYLNYCRECFLETKNKSWWWQMIQLLPSSYNQRRTVMLSYEVLANMHDSREFHKLDEWRELCKWIESLPYSELIIGEKETDDA